MKFLYLVVQQKMDSLLICPFFEAVTGDRGGRPTAEWHICGNNPRSLKWGIDIHFTTCNKLISCRKTGFLRKHSVFMTCRTSERIRMSENFVYTLVPQAKIKTVITFTKPFSIYDYHSVCCWFFCTARRSWWVERLHNG